VQDEQHSDLASQDLNGLDRVGYPSTKAFEAPFTFKVEDPSGNLHKLSSSADSFDQLVSILCERLKTTPACLRLKYMDEDGDEVLVSDDSSLSEAVDHARSKGDNFSRLRADIDDNYLVSPSAPLPLSLSELCVSRGTPKAVAAAAAAATTKADSGDQGTTSNGLNSLVLLGGASAAFGLIFAVFMVMKREAPSSGGGILMRTYTR
jgi:hypothetical protein